MFKNIAVILFFCVCLLPHSVLGNERIETAALFFNNDKSPEYQSDVDRNVLELARNDFSKELSLSIARSLNERSYLYRPEAAKRSILLNQLFSTSYFSADAKVNGSLINFDADYFEQDSTAILNFLKLSFKNKNSLKILFLYGHGVGSLGFKDIPTSLIKEQIMAWSNESGMQLDLLVLDSCFLGNVDFLYEMKELSRFTLSSPESEFSSGQPFDTLESLLEVDQKFVHLDREGRIKKIAEELLFKFLSSYSTVHKGKNKKNVISSSAVFNLIDNKKLNGLIPSLKRIRSTIDQFTLAEVDLFNKKIKKYQMENPELVDLGGMLLVLEEMGSSALKEEVKKLKKLLDLNSTDFRSVSPHVSLKSPKPNAILKVGINNWSRSDSLKLENVLEGKSWKKEDDFYLVKVEKIFKAYPFLPHIFEFNAQWIDGSTGQKIGEEFKIVRSSDLKVHFNNVTSPVAVFGFTESTKTYQKSYSGLSISNPLLSMPGIDYLDLSFQQATNWLR